MYHQMSVRIPMQMAENIRRKLYSLYCTMHSDQWVRWWVAAYGIYPEFSELYAFHLLYDKKGRESEVEDILKKKFSIERVETIPVRENKAINDHPLFKRYFLRFKGEKYQEEDEVVQVVMDINSRVDDAYVISSGKNMGIFKGVGYPEDIGRFFRLEEYEGYCWIAHGRFPTNSVGWWGGAHPFGLLSWSVVHNGEISSYGINVGIFQNFRLCSVINKRNTEVISLPDSLLAEKSHSHPY